MDFFTSDTHFYHKNILKYQAADRPFDDVDEMNEAMVKQWNRDVSPKDDVYHLGDFSMGQKEKTIELIARLNGKIHLIKGNHDHMLRDDDFHNMFESVQDYKVYKNNKRRIVLFHFPIQEWDRCHYGDMHLHGHSHGSLKDTKPNRIDIGWDVFKRLVPVEEVFSWRTMDAVPHHNATKLENK